MISRLEFIRNLTRKHDFRLGSPISDLFVLSLSTLPYVSCHAESRRRPSGDSDPADGRRPGALGRAADRKPGSEPLLKGTRMSTTKNDIGAKVE
jgi:hypothetical protein